MGVVSVVGWINGVTQGDRCLSLFAPPGDNGGVMVTRGGDDGACSPSSMGDSGEDGRGVSGGVCSGGGVESEGSLGVCSGTEDGPSGDDGDGEEVPGVGDFSLAGSEGVGGSGVVARVGGRLDVVGEPFRRAISASAIKL